MRAVVVPLLSLLLLVPGLVAKTKIGFVGLRHSHCWRQLQNPALTEHAEFVGVAESEPELVAYAKTLRPDAKYVDDYKRLIDEQKPEIVWAFVENNRHLEIAEYAAPRGVHLIFEKPLASTLEDARAIQALAKKHGIEVMTNYQMAWWPTNQHMKRQVDAGRLGDVRRLHGIVGHGGPGSKGSRSKYFFAWLTDPEKNGAGALVDFGCYNAVWALWIKGRPESVFAQAHRLQPEKFPKVEDNSVMVLSWPDAVGLFEGSWDLPHSFQDLELFGPEASMKMNRYGLDMRGSRRAGWTAVEPARLPDERSDPILYMLDRVESGKAVDNIMALDINVGAVEILEAAKESIKTGAAVELK